MQRFNTFTLDRIQWMSILVVACFVAILLLPSQSRASYPSYFLALLMFFSVAEWRDVTKLSLIRWVLILVLWLCTSVFWSDSFEWRAAVSVWSRALLVVLFVVAVGECQLRGQLQRWMDVAVTLFGALAVVAAILNFYFTAPLDGRLNGLGQLDTHVIAALVYGVVLLFVMRMALSTKNVPKQSVVLIVGLAIVVAVYLSDSRNAWISVSVGVGVFVLAHRSSDSRQFVITVLSMGLIAITALVILVLNDSTREVLLPRGDSFRMTIWAETIQQIRMDSFVFGRGILTLDDVVVRGITFDHPHNMYLALVHQGGLVAIFLYIVVLWKTLFTLLENFGNKDAKLALSILALAMSAHLLDGHELIDKVGDTWFLIWLPVGIALGLRWKPTPYPSLPE